MRIWSPHPRSAGWRSGFGSSNACSAARLWRSRSSRRLWILQGQKTDLAVAVAASGGYAVKRIAETLGVARSNLIERVAGKRPQRGPHTRAGDAELAAQRLLDTGPSY